MKLIATPLAIFIFEFKDNMLTLELYSIINKSISYILTINSDKPNESQTYELREGDKVRVIYGNPKTEKQVLANLKRDGFKVI